MKIGEKSREERNQEEKYPLIKNESKELKT